MWILVALGHQFPCLSATLGGALESSRCMLLSKNHTDRNCPTGAGEIVYTNISGASY